jgi:hypothetical protein
MDECVPSDAALQQLILRSILATDSEIGGSAPFIHPQVDGQSVIMLLSPQYKKPKIREVVMATTGIDNCLPYGMACTECNDLLVAPNWSAYVSKHEVRHLWSCENCGHEIEMTVNPRINAALKLSHGLGWSVVT